MTAAGPEAPLRLRLRGGGTVELGADAVRHPRSVRLGGSVTTPYEDVTHVSALPGLVRLGTRRGSFWLRGSDFAEPGGPGSLARELRARIARRAGGFAQLERMARLDGLAARPGPARLGPALALACAAVFAADAADPAIGYTGAFSALLARLGEPWRLVSAHFLHASLLHLALNAVALVVLGALAERSVGARAATVIAACAGLGAMAACWAAGYEHAVGASGLVYGLAGALLWLELARPEALPVSWRLPRRLFVGALLLESALLLPVPEVAHAAHAGGFAAGAVAAAAVGPRLGREGRPLRALLAANALCAGLALLAGVAWTRAAFFPDTGALARRGETLLAMDGVPPLFLNNEAWRIAIAPAPDPAALGVAERLAERAAEATHWAQPAVLDTLAEIHFAAGRPALAAELADAALALAPDDPYYQAQHRRFAEERAKAAPAPPSGAPRAPRRAPLRA